MLQGHTGITGKKERPIRVFLDTNVIISGLLTEEGYPRVILDVLSLKLPSLRGITGEINILELERNIRKKLPALKKPLIDALHRLGLDVVPFPDKGRIEALKDVIAFKDIAVLASAIDAGCSYLVTGDRHFMTPGVKRASSTLKVVTPAEFVEEILPSIILP